MSDGKGYRQTDRQVRQESATSRQGSKALLLFLFLAEHPNTHQIRSEGSTIIIVMIMTTTAANYHCQQLPEELLRRCFGLKGESDGKSSSLI